MMSHKFLLDVNFHLFLTSIDQELANEVQQQGCPQCGGTLHRADYPRSPCGIPASFREHYEKRLSFCCDICRKRMTSLSVRFFGRRWYPAPLLVLISALDVGITEWRCEQIRRHFGLVVRESTWKRWRRWWREGFTKTLFWQQARGQVPPDITGPFPRTLLDLFKGSCEHRVLQLLNFICPITAGILRAI